MATGSPHERDPEWVLDDVRDELVTPGAAAAVYGVAVVEDASHPYRWVLDDEGTRALRAATADA